MAPAPVRLTAINSPGSDKALKPESDLFFLMHIILFSSCFLYDLLRFPSFHSGAWDACFAVEPVVSAIAPSFPVLFVYTPSGPLLLGSMIVGIIFSMRGISLHPPRCTFLGAQAILGCMIAQNLTGSILTTLTAHWPMVIIILLATLISSAVIGWLLVRYSNLPGNTGAWGSSPGGAAAMVAMAQEYGADIRLVAFMQYLRVLLVVGAAALVTRVMMGDQPKRSVSKSSGFRR